MFAVVDILKLRHAWDFLFWSIMVLLTAVGHIIEVVLQFLVSCLTVDIRHTCGFDAFAYILLIHILKCVFVEVNWCWS